MGLESNPNPKPKTHVFFCNTSGSFGFFLMMHQILDDKKRSYRSFISQCFSFQPNGNPKASPTTATVPTPPQAPKAPNRQTTTTCTITATTTTTSRCTQSTRTRTRTKCSISARTSTKRARAPATTKPPAETITTTPTTATTQRCIFVFLYFGVNQTFVPKKFLGFGIQIFGFWVWVYKFLGFGFRFWV